MPLIALRHAVVEFGTVRERFRVVFGARHGLRPARLDSLFLAWLIRAISFTRRLPPSAMCRRMVDVPSIVLVHEIPPDREGRKLHTRHCTRAVKETAFVIWAIRSIGARR